MKITRIGEISPEILCRNKLKGEHMELHSIWSIIINGKKAFANHPGIMRMRGRLLALYLRHESLVNEMKERGYNHHTPFDQGLATGETIQSEFIDTVLEQVIIVREKE
ncbi:MAG: pyrimidine dimer DNA glycosylase/endonuclease V [ANME-2 cluster archaeon]|nr:pyrimidine dimer DNA glycosylase/endonuclease V [ANME-2 cluster archaeon]